MFECNATNGVLEYLTLFCMCPAQQLVTPSCKFRASWRHHLGCTNAGVSSCPPLTASLTQPCQCHLDVCDVTALLPGWLWASVGQDVYCKGSQTCCVACSARCQEQAPAAVDAGEAGQPTNTQSGHVGHQKCYFSLSCQGPMIRCLMQCDCASVAVVALPQVML